MKHSQPRIGAEVEIVSTRTVGRITAARPLPSGGWQLMLESAGETLPPIGAHECVYQDGPGAGSRVAEAPLLAVAAPAGHPVSGLTPVSGAELPLWFRRARMIVEGRPVSGSVGVTQNMLAALLIDFRTTLEGVLAGDEVMVAIGRELIEATR